MTEADAQAVWEWAKRPLTPLEAVMLDYQDALSSDPVRNKRYWDRVNELTQDAGPSCAPGAAEAGPQTAEASSPEPCGRHRS